MKVDTLIGTVCVVDEHEDSRDGICELLDPYGFNVHAHASAKELLKQACTHSHTGVIVVDSEMSEDATNVIRNRREQGCNVPVVLMTYYSSSEPALWASQHGAVVLQKPLRGNSFLQTISSILDLSRTKVS